MKSDTWQKLDSLFSEFPFMKASSVSSKEIAAAESRLGATFDPDYRSFIRQYGGAIVGAYPIIGLRHAGPMDDRAWSVVEVTERYRDQGWQGTDDWYVISIDHAGNPIGIDAAGILYKSDHDFGGVVKIANSFEEYLLICLASDSP